MAKTDNSYVPMDDAIVMAGNLGRDNGKNAASWVFDGNTPDSFYRLIGQMIEDGDPCLYGYIREPAFSDEYTTRNMMDELGFDFDATSATETEKLADAYIEACRYAFWEEVDRMIRRHFA